MVLISKVCEHVLRDFSHFWMLRFCAVSHGFLVICELQVFVNVLRDFIHVWMLQFCAVSLEFRVTCKLCVHYRFEVFSERFGFAHVLAIVTSGG